MKTISLTKGHVAIVDDEDYESLSRRRWSTQSTRQGLYAKTNDVRKAGKRRVFLMHRVVMGVTDPKVQVDHINHNGLDNRRENLRLVDTRANKSNLKGKKEGRYTSEYVGVHLHASGKYQASIRVNGSKRYLGLFLSEKVASDAYQQALEEMHSEANTQKK